MKAENEARDRKKIADDTLRQCQRTEVNTWFLMRIYWHRFTIHCFLQLHSERRSRTWHQNNRESDSNDDSKCRIVHEVLTRSRKDECVCSQSCKHKFNRRRQFNKFYWNLNKRQIVYRSFTCLRMQMLFVRWYNIIVWKQQKK